jgi:hypothetical protein
MTQLGIDQSMGIRSRSKAGTALVPVVSRMSGRRSTPPNGHSTFRKLPQWEGRGVSDTTALQKGDGLCLEAKGRPRNCEAPAVPAEWISETCLSKHWSRSTYQRFSLAPDRRPPFSESVNPTLLLD